MNILYTLNDKFVPQVAAGIYSIIENNNDIVDIHFYLFSYGITDKNKAQLTKMVKELKRDITIIEIETLRKYFDFEFDTLGWNPVILARLALDKILPSNVDKIIYLDGDTIVRGSLKDFWDTNMGNSCLGACTEPTVDKERKESLGIEKRYINSGVLLINLRLWRQEKIGEGIIQYYKDSGGKLFAPDQDAINGFLKDKIYKIPIKYNFSNTFTFYPYKTIKKLMGNDTDITLEEYNEAKENPIIIHYLGEERPWRKGNTHKYKKDFEYYLEKTYWKDMKFEDGWELYFLCWRIFNTFMKLTPMLRYNIINKLIPLFMKYRSHELKKNKEK